MMPDFLQAAVLGNPEAFAPSLWQQAVLIDRHKRG